MQNVATLDLVTATVSPEDAVQDVLGLSCPHGPRAAGVMKDGNLVGLLNCRLLPLMPRAAKVTEVMDPLPFGIEGSTPVRRVALEFLNQDIDYAPVFEKGRYIGIVTSHMLLREVGRSWDPLTGLGWSDRLREWGVAKLREGEDVTILFIDLDDFGMYNKKYGHIVGDLVLQTIAAKLKERCELRQDMLVRYGGDEFAIGTIRPREEAEALVASLLDEMSGLVVEDQLQAVTFCIGIFGGRRTNEREHVHLAAVIDNLINLASKQCMAQKLRKLV